ncbi:hypothetical protein C2G38_2175886 [Gigaspora rosea]|uniref:Uncharacterized protein n=1 Tax=Gigaspora rosea TaxID=44941 RepID=A0A397VL07_9GLOM|nr:hypothetical protein C2G38_2175886 [Gigaspora rosea]
MLSDRCGSLTQWNLNTLLLEKQYQLGWSSDCAVTFNKDSTLLAVINFLLGYYYIYIYLTENSLLLSQCIIKRHFEQRLKKLAFISSGESERILLFYYDIGIEIRDPYNLQHVVNGSNIYEELLKPLNDEALKKEFKTMFKDIIDEKIYYISDEYL